MHADIHISMACVIICPIIKSRIVFSVTVADVITMDTNANFRLFFVYF